MRSMCLLVSFFVAVCAITISNAEKTNTALELISIDFTNTSLKNIWPSDGLLLKFNIKNHYTQPTLDMYSILFSITIKNEDWDPYSNEAMIFGNKSVYTVSIKNWSASIWEISEIVSLDVSDCTFCEQPVDLFKFMDGTNMLSNMLSFNLYPYNFHGLIKPAVIIIHLERCNIFLEADVPKTKNNKDYNIPVEFNLSQNCYNRIGETYIVNITAFGSDSNHYYNSQLSIQINNNKSTSLQICTFRNVTNSDTCIILQQYSFTIDYILKPYHDYSDPSWYSDKYDTHIFISFSSSMLDIYPPKSPQIFPVISVSLQSEDSTGFTIILLVVCVIVIMCMIGCCFYYGPGCWKNHKRYTNAYVVKKVLVLIIGIAQFDDKNKFLDGVRRNVNDLVNLWKNYKYDVVVCHEKTLYSTKYDVIDFIDKYKTKLEEEYYQSVIVHIISHGFDKGQSFLSSDHKTISMEWIKHELTESAIQCRQLEDVSKNKPVIKVVFNHVCRGDINRQVGKSRGLLDGDIELEEKVDLSEEHWEDSNFAVVWGNIMDYAVSDVGDFTNCVVEFFGGNISKSKKMHFRELITEIRGELKRRTDGGQICEFSETLIDPSIRFEQNTHRKINSDESTAAKLLDQ
eukprot:222835_1